MASKTMMIEKIPETILKIRIVGDSDLILNKKARSYELPEIYKQSHPKGTEMPKVYSQPYNLFEKLLTSITWEKPITFHDDDWSLYTEEEWIETMKTNRPCILAPAFIGRFCETFKSLGFKDSTGKAGTDLKRAINLLKPLYPVNFESVEYFQGLVPSKALGNPNVLAQYNVFRGWSCEFELSVPTSVFPIDTVVSIIQTSGSYLGIGTRSNNGFGRYHIESVEAIG